MSARRGALVVAAPIVAALLAVLVVPAQAAVTPGPLPVVDGTPVCGVEGTGEARRLPLGSQLRLGTYNILHSQGEDPDADVTERLPHVVATMAAADADVWGLQEVTNNTEHGRVAELVAEGLAAATGERWEWCWFLSNPHFPGEPDVDEGGGGPLSELMAQFSNFPDPGDFREGLAVVTRFDVTSARSRRLTPRSYEAPFCIPPDPFACNLASVFDSRQVLWARLDTGPAGGLDFFTHHTAHGLTALSDATKLAQIKTVLATIDQWARPDALPDVLTGDFNSEPGTDRHQAVLDAGYVDTYAAAGAPECGSVAGDRQVGCTSDVDPLTATPRQPEGNLTARIDYVFARPGACGMRTGDSFILGNQPVQQPDGRWLWPSDHLGVRSRVACGKG